MRNQSGSSPRKEEEEGNNNNKEMGDVPVRKSNLLVKRKTTVSTLIPFLNHQFLYIYTHTLFCLLDSTFFCLAPTTRPTHLHITVYNLRNIRRTGRCWLCCWKTIFLVLVGYVIHAQVIQITLLVA